MGINSTEVSYGFGQMGSAYTDVDNVIIPPKGLVIVAIQFLENNTPTVLTPEKLDEQGPGFLAITDGVDAHAEIAGNNYFNFNGVHTSKIADAAVAAGADITLETVPSPLSRIKVGNYVLLVNETASEADTDMVIQTGQTPYPIYNGPSQQGVYVTEWDGASKVRLSGAIDTSSTTDQSLVFLDEFHGAGGITCTSQVFPKGVTIYGRWTEIDLASGTVVAYLGN